VRRRGPWAVALAIATAAGCLVPTRGLTAVALLLAVLAVGRRHPALACLAAAVGASTLAQRALDGLDGLREATVAAEVTLLSDPAPSFGGLRVDVRWDGRRLEARADGTPSAALRPRLAGEIVTVRGVVEPTAGSAPWLTARHVAGRLRILAVEGWRPGGVVGRAANGVRRTLDDGAAPLGARQRALFTGLVIGDDRGQPADLADSFRGAGLTHLLAVSGQNVAFVMVLAGPALRRLRLWPRWLATLGVIGLFGVMTRFEPSVLRASAMAALATTAALDGRPVERLRVLSWAVTGLLLVDPLLVRAVGFQLSVGATAAIVVLAAPLAAVLPGPGAVREAMGVSLAAQLGVAPILLHAFGPLPVVSLPANLLTVPVAGAVMVWGLTGGLVAGLVEPLAVVLHLPTRLALGWLELVAERSATAGLGRLHAVHVLGLVVGLAAAGARERPILRRTGCAVAVLAVGAAVVTAHAPPPLRSAPTAGVVRWHEAGTEVVVLGGAGGRRELREAQVLAALRETGVRRIDLLVVADPSVAGSVVHAVVRRHPVGEIVAAGRTLLDEETLSVARVPPTGSTAAVGNLEVRFVVVPERLVVDAAPRAAPDVGGPG